MTRATKDGPKKQVTHWLSVEEYCLVRDEAASRRIPMTDVLREWFKPHLDRLKKEKKSKKLSKSVYQIGKSEL